MNFTLRNLIAQLESEFNNGKFVKLTLSFGKVNELFEVKEPTVVIQANLENLGRQVNIQLQGKTTDEALESLAKELDAQAEQLNIQATSMKMLKELF